MYELRHRFMFQNSRDLRLVWCMRPYSNGCMRPYSNGCMRPYSNMGSRKHLQYCRCCLVSKKGQEDIAEVRGFRESF